MVFLTHTERDSQTGEPPLDPVALDSGIMLMRYWHLVRLLFASKDSIGLDAGGWCEALKLALNEHSLPTHFQLPLSLFSKFQ